MQHPVDKHEFFWPKDLMVSPTPVRRILIIGTCRDGGWEAACNGPHINVPADRELFYHTRVLPDEPPKSIDSYDLQLLLPPLRRIMPESAYFRLSYSDVEAFEVLLLSCKERLELYLHSMLRYNLEYGILTFVTNFLVPQRNPLGRLLPRYDLRNPIYFIERLNEILSSTIDGYKNVHLLDYDGLVAGYGRRSYQNDVIWSTNDGGTLGDADFELDQERLEATPRPSEVYHSEVYDYLLYAWRELLAMYRTIQQIDMVKLVVIDLDDTLWRGIAVERTGGFYEVMEGWPTGFIEALTCLKRRGVLLAIVSKNDEDRILQVWGKFIDENRLRLADFAMTRINWRSKAENIEEIISSLNLLPRSVVFIDDNPVERAAVKSAFPDIRTVGTSPYLWRRILLWAPETQVPSVTRESSERTEMVQAQIKREDQRQKLSREEFLETIGIEVKLREIDDIERDGFERAIELINKSNQFNTTGQRWTAKSFRDHFAVGGRLLTFEVSDKFTKYGSVGSVVILGSRIIQFVMSCRVVGLDVESAVIAEIANVFQNSGILTMEANLLKTDANRLCQDFYLRCGFDYDATLETLTLSLRNILNIPTHVSVGWDEPSTTSAPEKLLYP